MFGSHRRQLIKNLKREGVLKTPSIIDAVKTINRCDFVDTKYKNVAYDDFPIQIGYGQFVPQPHTIIFMIEHLNIKEGDKILEIGSGSGWALAILGKVVGKSGSVYGVERIPELVKLGKKNIAKYNKFKNIEIFQASAGLGLEDHAPYDKILVSATCNTLPQELVKQLKIGGFMIIPIESTMCKITCKSKTSTDIERYTGVSFVPLVY